MIIVLRVLLFLIPIVALILWLRLRSKRHLDEGLLEIEARKFRIGMLVLIVVLLATGFATRFTDEGSGKGDMIFVPARVENGKVIPGHFVPRDEGKPQEQDVEEAEKAPPPATGGTGEKSG